jgi:hypothetical protein
MMRSSGYEMSFAMAVPAAPDVAWPSAGSAGPIALWLLVSLEM